MNKDYKVTKSNNLITAKYNLSLQEQKIILTLASMVQPNDEDFKEYEFRIQDFLKMLDINSPNAYKELPQITRELKKKVFDIKEGNIIKQVSWLGQVEYRLGEGTLILGLDKGLKPYMLKLKEFTTYNLNNVLSLKSKYSIRFYELMKCNLFKKSVTYTVDELKEMFKADEKSYNIYQNFKNRVVVKAQKELNEKTDIKFEFEEIKTGRKVTSLKFFISSNNKNSSIAAEPKKIEKTKKSLTSPEEQKDIIYIANLLEDYDVTLKQAKQIYSSSEKNLEQIIKVFDYAKTQNVDNLVAYMTKMVEPGALQDKKKVIGKKNKFNNFKAREYDYDDLEKQLLGWDDAE